MKKNERYYYLVEGECEKKLLEVFKEQKSMIIPGKVSCFNIVQEHITTAFLRTLPDNTTVILLFDTDTNNADILLDNIRALTNHTHVKSVKCVPQVKNLEDELVKTTNIKEIRELLGSKSNKDFKHDFISEKRLFEKLRLHKFDFSVLWSSLPEGAFKRINNDANTIKVK